MHATQDTTEVSITQYIEVLRRRWIWVVMVPVALVGFTLFNDLRAQPIYQAQAELLLQSKASENIFTGAPAVSDPERTLQNELRIIRSRNVKLAVEEEYGSPVDVRAIAGGEDDIIILSATANTGEEAARRVNTYATTYQTARLDAILEDLTNSKNIVAQQIEDFQAQVNEIDEPLLEIDAQIEATDPTDPRYEELVATRERVKDRTNAARNEAQNQLNDYQGRLQLLQISERLTTTGGIQILNPATVPSSPISPTIMRNAIQALIVGLFLGVALAFARDQLDDRLRTKADLERATKDLPTLALVPGLPRGRDGRNTELATIAAPMSATAEAYRGLRTALQYAGQGRGTKVIQITSGSAAEGKTTTAANLAITFAQAGNRVVLVGCDLRKTKIHEVTRVNDDIGFTSVVLGYDSLDDALQTSPLHPNVDVLASGPLPPNPSELLNHERTAQIIGLLAERYDLVFVDCPPVLPVTDALVISRCVDATVYVTMANRTTRRTARRGIELLRQVGAPIVGTVINGVSGEDIYGQFYEYYGYTRSSGIPLLGRLFGRRHYDPPESLQQKLPDADKPERSAEPGIASAGANGSTAAEAQTTDAPASP